MDLSNIIQTSLEGALSSVTTTSQSISPQTSSGTIVIKPNDHRFTLPVTTTSNASGSNTIQLPSSTSTAKEQSIILPPNFNASGGPLLCQLDDNSYILIDGLDQLTTATNSTATNSPLKKITATSVSSTLPSTTIKQTIDSPSFTVTMKPSIAGVGKTSTTPTFTNTSFKKATPPQSATLKSPNTVTQPISQGTTRPTFLIMSNSPITKNTSSLSTKDSSSLVVTNQSGKQTVTNQSTPSSIKPFTNIITSDPTSQNINTPPLKYILVPQSKSTPVRSPNILSNTTGMKTITFNSQTLNLPIGTSLIPTNKVGFTNNNNLGTIIKPGSKIIAPSKIDLKVPPHHSTVAGKAPLVGGSNPSEITSIGKLFEDLTASEVDSDVPDLTINEEPKSPTLFDMTVDDINETINPGPTKTIITYSKTSPKATIKSLSQFNEFERSPTKVPTITQQTAKNLQLQTVVPLPTQSTSLPSGKLPMQYIVPTNVVKAPPVLPNRKRKPDSKNTIDAKKKKAEPAGQDPVVPDSSSTAPIITREVIASRNIQATDKAIISTAIHELKKLFAQRELVLKQLNTSCVALGKVEYKLTIGGAPVNITEIYSRLTAFQQQYETDLKRLDWAVSAMHKLYSELAPKDEMRSTEEILKDLIGPTEGIPDDPSAKYEKFKVLSSPPAKKVTNPKPKARSPKRPAKSYYIKGDEGSPTSLLEERKVPDKPNASDGKFHCELCSKIFLKQISLAKHLEFDHPVSLELEKRLTTSRSPKLPHACQDCNKSFHSNVMLTIHRSDEHDAPDTYQLSRESKRSASDSHLSDTDMKSPSEDESKQKKITKSNTMATRSAKAVRRVKKPIRRTRSNNNNSKTKTKVIDSLDFLYDSDATLPNSPISRQNWREVDLFDPDIPIECTDSNPIIPLKPLSEEVIAAYTYSSRRH